MVGRAALATGQRAVKCRMPEHGDTEPEKDRSEEENAEHHATSLSCAFILYLRWADGKRLQVEFT